MLVVVRCRSRVNMAVVQCRCRPMLVTVLPSPAGDDVAEATWPHRDVDVESCWRGTVEVTWLWRDGATESC
jgi:hypothetical protein